MKKIICTFFYILGIICVCYYGVIFLSHNETIQNPQAMLPIMEYERASFILAIGAIPMCTACFGMCWAYNLKIKLNKKYKKIIFLIFLPSIPCVLCFLYIIVIIAIMIIEGYLDAIKYIFIK